MTTRALLIMPKWLSRVAIPSRRGNGGAYRFDHAFNRVFDPDGAFTVTQGVAGDGPGDYITFNRTSIIEFNVIQSMDSNLFDNPHVQIHLNDGTTALGAWQDAYFHTPSDPLSNQENWEVGVYNEGNDEIYIGQICYRGIVQPGWRAYLTIQGSNQNMDNNEDAVTWYTYEITDDVGAALLAGQGFPPVIP
jgi:hypothetical protein